MTALVLNRRRTSVWGALAAVAAMGTGLAVYSYLSYVKAQIPIAGKLVPMLVAAGDIDPGATLGTQMLELVDHPGRYLPADALTSKAGALGRVVTVPIFKGETITGRKLGERGGASSVVPSGQRAYSLSVESAAGLGFVPRPGDRVDVIATFPQEVLGEPTTLTVLTSKEVASVGPMKQESDQGEKVAGKFGIPGSSGQTLGLTLFVSPSEAQELAMAESLGKTTVVLAPNRSTQVPPSRRVTPRDIGG